MKTAVYLKAPTASSVRLINFTRAEVRPGFLPNTWILIVSGKKPYANMTVELRPLIYIRRPEFWGIEVTGSLPGIGIPMVSPYTVSLPLDGILGTKGIEVIGATRRKKIYVPPIAKPPTKKASARKKK